MEFLTVKIRISSKLGCKLSWVWVWVASVCYRFYPPRKNLKLHHLHFLEPPQTTSIQLGYPSKTTIHSWDFLDPRSNTSLRKLSRVKKFNGTVEPPTPPLPPIPELMLKDSIPAVVVCKDSWMIV